MFCTKCGTDLPDDSRFCRSCGQTLGVVSTRGGAAAAVAPARIPTSVAAPQLKRGMPLGVKLVALAALALFAGFLWLVITTNNGSNAASNPKGHTPITLTDEVENLPAASWKAVGLNLPYSGTVNVSLAVVKRNPVDVFLTRADQLETIKKEQWNNVQVFTDFNASKTNTYRRDAQLGQGGYYLVIRDTSLGILSASASDISVKVQLNP